ncbi:MAG: outer membrane lipoprotein carrier protein LolA [Syntrophales bacterium]|nr:outer membrane lipoprotein carrier protein LolA [Syntrophales bacterium]
MKKICHSLLAMKNVEKWKQKIFVIGISVILWLGLFPVLPALAKSLLLSELIAKTQESYEKTEDLKAKFVQEVTIKSMDKTEREEGFFYFKKPISMSWDYVKPKAKRLVLNREKAYLYIPADHAVYVQDVESIFKSSPTIKFFSGLGKLQDDFQINFSQPDPCDRDGNYLLTLVPRNSAYGIQRLSLTIDRDNFQLLRCSFTDIYGNATCIRFRDIKVNNKLSDKLFTFKPPPGVEVVNMP